MQSDAQLQICRVGAQDGFELLRQFGHGLEAITGEFRHDDRVLLGWIW